MTCHSLPFDNQKDFESEEIGYEVEGQITRPKLTKKQMYECARIERLRLRVLQPS
jgi:hypothetical protein